MKFLIIRLICKLTNPIHTREYELWQYEQHKTIIERLRARALRDFMVANEGDEEVKGERKAINKWKGEEGAAEGKKGEGQLERRGDTRGEEHGMGRRSHRPRGFRHKEGSKVKVNNFVKKN